jgi:hypothetical protein
MCCPRRWNNSYALLQLKNVKLGQKGMDFGVTPQILSTDIMKKSLEHLHMLYGDQIYEKVYKTSDDHEWSEYTIYRYGH